MSNQKVDYNWLDYLIHGIYFLVYSPFKYLPSPVGDFLRYWISKPFFKHLGRVRIYEGVTLWYPYRTIIGDNVTLNEWIYISGYGRITIGNDVRIGHRTSILSSNHIFHDRNTPIYKQGLENKPVSIEDDVWIGCNVTILGGVKIGTGAVIAAGSVVTADVESYSIVAGTPARKIGQRENSNELLYN
jgi:Acetyltransferase (isoleucine patch superfamily)